MNYNTIVAATIMASQINDARQQERERIVVLLVKAGFKDAAELVAGGGK